MMRSAAKKLAPILEHFSESVKYPTRTVESAFAWFQGVWSYSVIAHTGMVTGRVPGNVYGPLLDLMPAEVWGWGGIVMSTMRIIALIGNGAWRPSPELRLIGAAWGAMFWTMLFYAYYIAVEINGAPDFPMRRGLLVLVYFELYSCYRCGQDIGKRQKNEQRQRNSEPSRLMDADYG